MHVDTRHTPKSLRARLELSTEQLAARARERGEQVTGRTVRYFEAGRDVSTSTLAALAGALEVTVDVLLDAWKFERERQAAAKGAA